MRLVGPAITGIAASFGFDVKNATMVGVRLRLGQSITIKRPIAITPRELEAAGAITNQGQTLVPDRVYDVYRNKRPTVTTVTRGIGQKFLFIPNETYLCSSWEIVNIPMAYGIQLFQEATTFLPGQGLAHKLLGYYAPPFIGPISFEFMVDFPLELVIGAVAPFVAVIDQTM